MKKITLLTGIVFASLVGAAQTISTFPYTEDFETQANCPTGCGAACQTITDWTNPTSDDLDWLVDDNGTSSGGTGPTANGGADHTTGAAGGKYVFVETSCSGTGYSNMSAILESPYFDFTALTDAKLEFWYHAFGATQGPLNVEARIGSQGTWANIAGPIQDNQDLWQKESVCFGPTYAGNDSVQVRFSYVSGTNFTGDIALDDISVLALTPFDVGVTAVTGPSGCGLTSTEVLDITICNFGDSLVPGTVVPVSFAIDGGTAVVENFTLTNGLASSCNNGCINFTSTTTFDLSVSGPHTLQASSGLAGDVTTVNDTAMGTSTNIPIGGTLPYFANFESGQEGWSINAIANSTMEYGAPANTIINSAASGDSAFVTGLTGTYNAAENSNVTSPCIDITTATGAEVVTMKVWWSSENSWDGANLFGSNDGGSTWNQLGAFGDANNWYNDNSINGNPNGSGDGWTGDAGNGSAGWVVAQHELDSAMMVDNDAIMLRVGFGSDGSVQREGFAFDDVAVGLPTHTYEYGVAGIDSIMGVCNNTYTFDAGAGQAFYHWADLNNNYNGTWANTQTLTVTSGGTYVITVTDAMGMMATDTVFLELLGFEPPMLTSVTSCIPGDSAMFDAGSGATPADILYTWSNGDTTQTSWLFATGTISVTKTDTALGCTAVDSAIFSDQPIFDLGPDTNLCGLASFDLFSGMDPLMVGSYLWNDASTNDTLNTTTTNNYYLTITDTGGCVGTDSIMVTFNPAASVNLGNDTTVCANHLITLDAGTATSYLWNDATTAQTLAVTATGTFYVSIIDANGCPATDSIDVTVDPCAGVEELGSEAKVSLYPNPTTGNITVSLKEFGTDVTLTVVNVYGQVVRSERVTAETVNLDLNNLSEGTYLLRLQSEESISVNKFIINR